MARHGIWVTNASHFGRMGFDMKTKKRLENLKAANIDIQSHGYGFAAFDMNPKSFKLIGFYKLQRSAINAGESYLKTMRGFSNRCYDAFRDTLIGCGFDFQQASAEWDALIDRT